MADNDVNGPGVKGSDPNGSPDVGSVTVTPDDIAGDWNIPAGKPETTGGPDNTNKPDGDGKGTGPGAESPGSPDPDNQKKEVVYKSIEELQTAHNKLLAERDKTETFIGTLKSENKVFREDFPAKLDAILAKIESGATGDGSPEGEKKSFLEAYAKKNPAVAKAIDSLTGTLGEAEIGDLDKIFEAVTGDLNDKFAQREKADMLRENESIMAGIAEEYPEFKDPAVEAKMKEFIETSSKNLTPRFLAEMPLHYARSQMIPTIVQNMVNKVLPQAVEAELKKRIGSGAVVGVGPGGTPTGAVPNKSQEALDNEWNV